MAPMALEASAQSRGETPLHRAAREGLADCVELLLKAGAKKARPPPLPGWLWGLGQ